MIFNKLATFLFICLIALPAIAKVTFNFTFNEQNCNFDEACNTDKQFDARLIDYIKNQCYEAGEILGSYLNHDQSVDILVFLHSKNENVKGRATSALSSSGEIKKAGFYGTIVADKIQYGIDRNGEKEDGIIWINLFRKDEEGCHLQEAIENPEDYYDICTNMKRVIIHELIHTLGFTGELSFQLSNMRPTLLEVIRADLKTEIKFNEFYNQLIANKTFNYIEHCNYQGTGIFSNYDYFIQDQEGNPLWEQNLNSSTLAQPAYFSGPKTQEAFFGLPLPLPFDSAKENIDFYHSSGPDILSMLFISNLMSNALFGYNEEPLRLSSIEIAILEDIGFNINVQRALRTEMPKYCLNLQNIDTHDIRSILAAWMNLLPEETTSSLKQYIAKYETKEKR